jgi:3-oxoacyl-[acyl-carrier protein] reductase
METDFSGRQALVVGGTGGIGATIAQGLAERGAQVTVHGGSSEDRLRRVLQGISSVGGTAQGFLHPITSAESVDSLFRRLPRVDILVWAWGPFLRKPLETYTSGDWEYLAKANFSWPGAMVSLTLRGMLDRGWGRLLLFGGTNTDTIRGFTSTAVYSAAKTALAVVVKSTAKTAADRGVTCNMICPGFVDTEYLSEEARAYGKSKSPNHTLLSTRAVAELGIQILLSSQINGAIIPMDGGVTL